MRVSYKKAWQQRQRYPDFQTSGWIKLQKHVRQMCLQAQAEMKDNIGFRIFYLYCSVSLPTLWKCDTKLLECLFSKLIVSALVYLN